MKSRILASAFLLLTIIFGGTTAFAQTKPDISTPEKFLTYLSANRNNVALASFSLKANGTIDIREPIIAHNIDVKMPLESLGKVIHLAAYAKALSIGEIQSNRIVTVGEWENYFIPGIDGTAHAASLEDLGIPHDEFGFAENPETPVAVEQMVKAMIKFSDNAVPDWLLANISRQTFRLVIRDGGLSNQDFPIFFTGTDLSFENHEIGLSTIANVNRLKSLSKQQYSALVNSLTAKFQNPQWRAAEFEFRLANIDTIGNREPLKAGLPSLAVSGTVKDYAFLMARISTGSFISPAISATMRSFLEQSFLIEALNETSLYSVFGEKIGASSGGFVTNASCSIPSVGDFTGKRRITVLFQRLIDFDVFDEQFTTLIPFKFESKLIRERAFAKQVRRVFNGY
jgi:D-alanyl-D-alanine carboxypeptidase